MTNKFIAIPIGFAQFFNHQNEAVLDARQKTEQYGGTVAGFEVLEVKSLGRFEHCSPIWIDAEWEKSRDSTTNAKPSDTPKSAAAASPAPSAIPTPESTTLSGHPTQTASDESESANPVDIPF